MSRGALAILISAIALGAALRFVDIGSREFSPDEAASWAPAKAPTLHEIADLQAELNPGKLPIYEFLLHGWIGAFGDGLAAMRGLSAAFGTLAILVTFWTTRELLTPREAESAPVDRDTTAALAALICAVSLVTIKYSRESRVYPLMLALNVAQVGAFAQALRKPRRGQGLVVLTWLSIAANFASALLVGAEILWICIVATESGRTSWNPRLARALLAAFDLAIAIAFLLPFARFAARSTTAALARGTYEWIKPVPPWEPVSLFSRASGTLPFPALLALAAWGTYRGWRRDRDAVAFALIWMWAPPIFLLLGSYVLRPLFVERFLMAEFIPFFILAAIGLRELAGAGRSAQAAATVAIVSLSLAHVGSWMRKPHDQQWREATEVAARNLAPRQTIGALPRYGIEVVRYYLPESDRDRAERFARGTAPSAAIMVTSDSGVSPVLAAGVAAQYPKVLASLRGITVRTR